jgi:protoheme IX farnesyltransferase
MVDWRDYFAMTKPKVVALLVLTALIGMILANDPDVRWLPPLDTLLWGNLGIALAAMGAAVINHVVDARVDAIMARTESRPIPQGKVRPLPALLFASLLTALSMAILLYFVNELTAWLTLFGLVGYAFVYTLYLKRATPQNIVIGGISGAVPPLLGWTAVTNEIDPQALLLVLIIYTWTPPHFWALAIARRDDYARANIPMLPVTHGVEFTKTALILYTWLLLLVTLLPYLVGMSGLIYLVGAIVLAVKFLHYAYLLRRDDRYAMPTFGYSIVYLMLLFTLFVVDHYLFFHPYMRGTA